VFALFARHLAGAAGGIGSAGGIAVEDLQATLERLLIDAEDCALIGKLATDKSKRDLFNRLAADLRRHRTSMP
jgi:hypothetical protein